MEATLTIMAEEVSRSYRVFPEINPYYYKIKNKKYLNLKNNERRLESGL